MCGCVWCSCGCCCVGLSVSVSRGVSECCCVDELIVRQCGVSLVRHKAAAPRLSCRATRSIRAGSTALVSVTVWLHTSEEDVRAVVDMSADSARAANSQRACRVWRAVTWRGQRKGNTAAVLSHPVRRQRRPLEYVVDHCNQPVYGEWNSSP